MSQRLTASAWWALPIAFFIMCSGWALTSPVGSAPDDDFHLSSIWCAQGERAGVCEETPANPAARLVPANVAAASDCFRFKADVSAGCATSIMDDAGLVETERVNVTASLYPPGFHAVMSVFVGPEVERSVLAMRLFNAALTALVIAALLRLTPAGLASASVLAITVTFIPLGLFVTASTNPSAWSIIGIGGYWAFAIAFLRHRNWRDRRGLLLVAATLVTAAMAIGSRVDASAYVVLATLIALTVSGWKRALGTPGRLVTLGAIGLVAVVTYVTVSPVDVIAPSGAAMGDTHAGAGLFLTNLVYLPTLFQGIVGGWNLGWNDTLMPPFIPVIGTALVGALLYRGLQEATVRKLAATALAAGSLILVPLIFLQSQGLGVGEVVQPRYLLPLLTLLVGVVSLGPRFGRPLPLPVTPAIVMAVGVTLSAVLAFWANAHRYFAGSGFGLFDPKEEPAWTTATGIPLAVIAVVTIIATAVFISGLFQVAAESPIDSASGRVRRFERR